MVIIYLDQDIIHQRSHLGMFLRNCVVLHICRMPWWKVVEKIEKLFHSCSEAFGSLSAQSQWHRSPTSQNADRESSQKSH